MKIGLQAWGSEGDISPFLALSSALARRGNDVTLVVSDNLGRDYSSHATHGGFELISIPPPPEHGRDPESVWREIIQVGNPLRQAELVLKYGYDPVAEPMLEAAKALVARAEAVVGHFFAYPLQIAAELAGKPSATLNIVHNCIPTRTRQAPGLPDLGSWSHGVGWKLAQGIVNRIFLPRYNGQRLRCGLHPVKDTMTEAWVSKRLNIVGVSPTICERPPDWSSNHVITGFISEVEPPSTSPLPEELNAFLLQEAMPVFIGFGSMMMPGARHYAEETIKIWRETIQKLNVRAVFQLPQPLLSLVTNNSVFHAVSWADYRALFPKCLAIVHHGGAGTTQSALRAGRPSLVVAHVSDQFFWGQELERLGVAGPTCRRKGLSASKLSKAIADTLHNKALPLNAQRLGERLSAEDGVGAAVDAILSRLGR